VGSALEDGWAGWDGRGMMLLRWGWGWWGFGVSEGRGGWWRCGGGVVGRTNEHVLGCKSFQ